MKKVLYALFVLVPTAIAAFLYGNYRGFDKHEAEIMICMIIVSLCCSSLWALPQTRIWNRAIRFLKSRDTLEG